jgi:hypothetical protein
MGQIDRHRSFVRAAGASLARGLLGIMVASSASAKPAVVLGDSIGVGISMVAGLPRLAHNSVSIRSADTLAQIKRTPAETVAFLSLGTNDAVGSIAGVERGIDRIVEAARQANIKLVWVGPPCVLQRWNVTALRLDAILRGRLADKVPYVSLADPDVCLRSLRAGDGVHFNMRGYALLWSRASGAVEGPFDVTVPPAPGKARHDRDRKVALQSLDEAGAPPRPATEPILKEAAGVR